MVLGRPARPAHPPNPAPSHLLPSQQSVLPLQGGAMTVRSRPLQSALVVAHPSAELLLPQRPAPTGRLREQQLPRPELLTPRRARNLPSPESEATRSWARAFEASCDHGGVIGPSRLAVLILYMACCPARAVSWRGRPVGCMADQTCPVLGRVRWMDSDRNGERGDVALGDGGRVADLRGIRGV